MTNANGRTARPTRLQTEQRRPAQKKLEGTSRESQDELKNADETAQESRQHVDEQADNIERYSGREKVECSRRRDHRVDQRNRTVWINLGRADALMRQVTFSVYPADTTDMTAKGKKGTSRSRKFFDEHLSEARILDDDISTPSCPATRSTPLCGAPAIDGTSRWPACSTSTATAVAT